MLAATTSTALALVAAAGAGCAVAGGALFVHRRVWGFLPEDVPGGARKQHARPTPVVGFLLAGVAAVGLLATGETTLAAALALLLAVGFVDDRGKQRGGLSWRVKAIAQLVAGAAIAASVAPRADLWAWLVLVGFAFVVVNAVNFLDNMNGVSALVGGLGVLLATGGEGPLALAGAVFLGFLPFNWPRASLFLGDGGALPLGGLLAAAALAPAADATGGLRLLVLLAPTAIPLLDFTQVVLARVWLGYAPWVGDRRHVTHIATYVGVPAAWVAPMLGAAAAGAWALLTWLA